MSITKDNFIVVYVYGNLDSEEFANYYANVYDIDVITEDPSGNSGITSNGIYWQVDGQKVGIQMLTTTEILDYEDFLINIEEPLSAALNSSELSNRNIWGILLGYRVPGGFYYEEACGIFLDEIDLIAPPFLIPCGSESVAISATSRLSRINNNFSLQKENKLYNRQVFKRFDSDDAELSLIVSRIDGPNLQFAKNIVDNAEILNKQFLVNGTFYIDPYSDKNTTGAGEYTDLLVDFYNNILQDLNLKDWITTFVDPYIDATIPFVENDSFVWSWFADRATTSFFQNTNAIRTFFYNADYDGGITVRDDSGKTWPYLALNAGYVATAGALSNPTIPGFLDPNAFFYSLLRGATIGEAFYFSVPHLDWTISLFGDPLVTCFFPGVETVEEDIINEHFVWEMMSKDLARSAANLYKKERELREIVDNIVDITSEGELVGSDITSNTEFAVQLLYPANDLLVNNKDIVWKGQLKPLVNKLFDFPTFRYIAGNSATVRPSINNYLSDNNFKVSRILANITSESIPIVESNLLDEGWWQFEFVLQDDDTTEYVNYHFILEVSDNENFDDDINISDGFTNILMTKDSFAITNWTYEKEKETFVSLTSNGVSSSYIGRRVRYESRVDDLLGINEYLTRGETYYFRITQYNIETLEQYTTREYSDIIYS